MVVSASARSAITSQDIGSAAWAVAAEDPPAPHATASAIATAPPPNIEPNRRVVMFFLSVYRIADTFRLSPAHPEQSTKSGVVEGLPPVSFVWDLSPE